MQHFTAKGSTPTAMPFGQWLLTQVERQDAIGELARGASRDPRFPSAGAVEDVCYRLSQLGAEPEMFIALDDAELDWAAF
ncbi:MAG TPA: hypothetical protein VF463_08505 [Sphingobium sp.]